MEKDVKKWITVNGAHIPILEGETEREAIAKLSTSELEKVLRQELKDKPEITVYDTASEIRKALTPKEWRRVYTKLGEIETGAYFPLDENERIVMPLHIMEDNSKPKLLSVAGKYVDARVKSVIIFESEEKMFDFLGRFAK